jgi:DNA-binding GntR family transcriptional regulator
MNSNLSSQRIYSELRQQIIDRSIPPGTKLTESSLCKKWNVSRTPLREVLRQLESEGLIISYPYRGFEVNTITIEDVDHLYTIKIHLEGLAGRLAAAPLSADSSRLKALEKLCKEMEVLSKHGDVNGYVKKNSEFHFFICQCCGNSWLNKILENLDAQINRFIVRALHIPHRMERSVNEHWEIFERFRSGNGRRVEQAIADHFESALKDLKRELVK